MPPHLAGPNRLVRAYASAARLSALQAEQASSDDAARGHAVAANTMAVACVETYLNVFARLWLEQEPDFVHIKQIEQDLKTKKNLGRKLEEWPELFFGKKANLGSGPGQRFRACLERRNRLMHFHSDAHTFTADQITIKGLIDTTAYETLQPTDALAFVEAAEGFIEYLIQLQGIAPEQVANAMHHWVGRLPSAA